ncbi:Superfamily I DNA or RNA helicase [Pedobacter steynii]|uniref:DNA 3'-5' helicase n=1 Tax=Pedobacter steynii TaxID=430522 RepID=A0A1H0KC52_9SPHI|nr:ATP-dependent helicase [Pedobacter steynii]NQX43250.1 ATP-dependent helicase [Pedobacter steynii]SDO53341.1 Superfamily I DNA or RNA helicase [Pedobacter steynii]
MRLIQPNEWHPADGLELEDNALEVVTSNENNLVVAGPGAGKTELLAQRACYLLQTNTCKYPHKILAISFKNDAAYNLRERVRQRCGEEASKRFDSFTFDSFAKQIVDRFCAAIPADYRLSKDYEIIIRDNRIKDLYKAASLDFFNTKEHLIKFHTEQALPISGGKNEDIYRKAVWKDLLTAQPQQLVSFPMLMRIAQLLIDTNPLVKKYLQQTYHFVFLDEFQDTTQVQYDFFKSCFLDSPSVFTAVGDDKQRIMVWAGAKIKVFEEFLTDTTAQSIALSLNFRSAPRLVELQNYLTEHLLNKPDKAIPSKKWKADQGECDVWLLQSQEQEKKYLFKKVSRWLQNDSVKPRDICILVKQQLEAYVGDLIKYFNENGINARDETILQNLITEDFVIYIVNSMYFLIDKKNGDAKRLAMQFLGNLRTEFYDEQLLRLDLGYNNFVAKLRGNYRRPLTDKLMNDLIQEIVDFAGIDRIKSHFPQYKVGSCFSEDLERVKAFIKNYYAIHKTLKPALDGFMGVNTIPVMTVHKSKGLEYHTVIFVGLEDGAFWSFNTQADEDKCTFFVALSRAKERVVFTFSKTRNSTRNSNQSLKSIRVLFEELQKSKIANIQEIK